MLDNKEEKRFQEFKAMARELKVPCPPEIFIGLQVYDKDDNLIFDDLQRGHSWTRNFWNSIIACNLEFTNSQASFGPGYMSTKKTTGAVVGNGFYTVGYIIGMPAGGINSSATGIQVGTSDTPFSTEQYNLGALISTGSSSGQLAYQAEPAVTALYDSPNKIWTMTKERIFNNNSGNAITVKEVGIMGANPNNGPAYYLMERSLLSPVATIPDAGRLRVTYNISMDFSAID